MRLVLCGLMLLINGCAIQAAGFGVEVAWVIGEASIGCDWEEGYPKGGSDCIVGGHLSEEAASVLTNEEEHNVEKSEVQ